MSERSAAFAGAEGRPEVHAEAVAGGRKDQVRDTSSGDDHLTENTGPERSRESACRNVAERRIEDTNIEEVVNLIVGRKFNARSAGAPKDNASKDNGARA